MSSTLSIFLTMVCLSTWAAATVRLAEEIERINARIDELQKKHSNFVQRQSNQSQHSSISCKSHFQLPQKTDNPSKILCSHTSFNISSHIFQTSKQIYVVVNHPTTRQFEVYNAKCVHLASADKVVLRVLCDRGVCQNGKVYFIATDYTLNVMNEDQNFTVILSLGQVSAANNYVGAVIRHKYPDKEQIFIGEHRGLVKVYDEQGVKKIEVTLQNKVQLLLDSHPFPLLLTPAGWISYLDTIKYSEHHTKCPFVKGVLTLFADTVNYHRLYAITERFVYVLDLKKECEIVRVIGGVSFGDEDLSPTLISLSRNILYVGHHVVSLTDGRVYLSKCYLQFAHKKHSFDKELMVTTCCQERTCLARFSEKTQKGQDMNILLWVTLSFVVLLLLSMRCLAKKASPMTDYNDDNLYKQLQMQHEQMAARQRLIRDKRQQKDSMMTNKTK